MDAKTAKQVIVMRKDLNMRKGKMIAQGAHASMGAWLLIADALKEFEQGTYDPVDDLYSRDVYEAAVSWIEGKFTKVCVGVDDESTLDDVHDAALALGLPVKMIVDSGATEFHGVPTKTCLAIGPAWAEDIDKITGHLTLL